MKRETIQRVATPTALVVTVGMGESLVDALSEAMNQGGLRVLRAAHVAAACERIPVVMPQLVVVSSAVSPHDNELLADRCVAVGADVFRVDLAAPADEARLRARLRDAAQLALIRTLRSAT